MLFEIEILDKPDTRGHSRVLGRLAHTGATVDDALRSAKANLRTPSMLADSFSMKMRVKEVARWSAAEARQTIRVKRMSGGSQTLKKPVDLAEDK